MTTFHFTLFALVVCLGGCFAQCPPLTSLRLVGCYCKEDKNLGFITCIDLEEQEYFRKLLNITTGYQLQYVSFENLVLDWFPVDTFDLLDTQKLVIRFGQIGKLTRPEDGDRLFKNSSLMELHLQYTDIEDGDLSPLGNIPKLTKIEVIMFQKDITISSLATHLQNATNLKHFTVVGSGFIWSRGALSSLQQQLEEICVLVANFTVLQKEDFPKNLSKLRSLVVRHNEIESISDNFFSGMKELNYIDLDHNKLTTLNEKTFQIFNGRLSLQENPWNCDSRLDWLIRRVKERSIIVNAYNAKCSDGRPLIP